MKPRNLPLRRFIPSNPFFQEVTATNLNQSVDTLNDLIRDVAANERPLSVGDGSVVGVFLGAITDTGPSSESDDTAASRYWVKVQRPDETLSCGDTLTLVDEEMPGANLTVRATNLSEASNSHTLSTDETVYVQLFQVIYSGYPTAVHWYFFRDPPANMVVAQLSSDGGAIGTQTTASTWTYTATDVNGTQLGTGLSPQVSRPNGRLAAASWGWGYNAANGSGFVLVKAEEIEDTGGC